MLRVLVPIRTGRGLNDREHWRARAQRIAFEKHAVGYMLKSAPREPVRLPCVVLLTRIAPSNGLDDDNLLGALKSVRDAFADWLGIDDRRAELVRYTYAQERGQWAVRIETVPA